MRRQGWWHVGAGVTLLALAVTGLVRDLAWLAQPFYAWVWWGYILLLDGYCAIKQGDSLLTTRRRFFIPICIWSVTFWFLFELINARIQNWYYVGVFPLDSYVAGPVFAVTAFATVFMGIFQTMDALNASGLWRHWRCRGVLVSTRLTYQLQGIGLVLAGVALVFPHYLAPLIWGSFTLLVDPWNYRRGARSLLRDLEKGDLGLMARLLLAGLICGVVWESLNFVAPQKWIYTVRGLEGFKVFEMPLLGFLGFPALALDCMAGFALFSSFFLGNRSWERPDHLSYSLALHTPRGRRVFWQAAMVQVLFWGWVSLQATSVNVASVQVELRDLGMSPKEEANLLELGIARPRQFLFATRTKAGQGRTLAAFNGDAARLVELRRRAELYTFKGIGLDHGRALERVGVRTPQDLRNWEPEQLMAALSFQPVERPVAPPRLDFVKVWIHAARGVRLD